MRNNGRQARAAQAAPTGGSVQVSTPKDETILAEAIRQHKAAVNLGRPTPSRHLEIIEAAKAAEAAEAAAKKAKEDAEAAAKEDAKASTKVEKNGLNEYQRFVRRSLMFKSP